MGSDRVEAYSKLAGAITLILRRYLRLLEKNFGFILRALKIVRLKRYSFENSLFTKVLNSFCAVLFRYWHCKAICIIYTNLADVALF